MVFSLRDFKSSLYGREQAQQNRFEIFLKCKLFTGESNRYVSLRAENFGFIFQKLNLIDYLSVKQNIALVNDNLNSFNIDKIIGELGLAEKGNQRVKNLSFGEAQRVAIARGVINNPKVIFADEPTSALDDTNTEIVMKMIFDYADKNDSTLVVCTHDDRVKSFFSNPMVIK